MCTNTIHVDDTAAALKPKIGRGGPVGALQLHKHGLASGAIL